MCTPLSQQDQQAQESYWNLLVVDFECVHQAQRYFDEARSKAYTYMVTLLSIPVVFLGVLIAQKLVTPDQVLRSIRIPDYFSVVITAAGILVIIPYYFFANSSINQILCLRAINSYRRLGVEGLQGYGLINTWKPAAPLDPHHPKIFDPLSSTGIYMIISAIISSLYIAYGLSNLMGYVFWQTFLCSLLYGAILFGIYYLRCKRVH
ncbi:MAG: hypothetical protein ABTR54_16460 [Candidatus Competibacter sp.]